MLYYGEYSNGRRYVHAYDEKKHGTPRIVGNIVFLYHNTICGSADGMFSTEEAALASWGKYSNRPVIMPDGREVTPARYFGNDTIADVFIPWSMVRGELWPGEY